MDCRLSIPASRFNDGTFFKACGPVLSTGFGRGVQWSGRSCGMDRVGAELVGRGCQDELPEQANGIGYQSRLAGRLPPGSETS